jgi:hypothetical protein
MASSSTSALVATGSLQPKKPTPILFRFVNNFVVLHQSKEVIEHAQTFLEEWFKNPNCSVYLTYTQFRH